MKKFLIALSTTIVLVLATPGAVLAGENITSGIKYRLKGFKDFVGESSPTDPVRFTQCGKYFATSQTTGGNITFFVGEYYASDGPYKSQEKIFLAGDLGERIPVAIDNGLQEPIAIREVGAVEDPRYTVWMNLREYLNSPCLIRGGNI